MCPNQTVSFSEQCQLSAVLSSYLYSCLELQQLHNESFGYNPAKVCPSKQQRIVLVAFSPRRCQDQLVGPEEGVEGCVMEFFLQAGAAVDGRPQLNRVGGELDGLEASRENSHDYS